MPERHLIQRRIRPSQLPQKTFVSGVTYLECLLIQRGDWASVAAAVWWFLRDPPVGGCLTLVSLYPVFTFIILPELPSHTCLSLISYCTLRLCETREPCLFCFRVFLITYEAEYVGTEVVELACIAFLYGQECICSFKVAFVFFLILLRLPYFRNEGDNNI